MTMLETREALPAESGATICWEPCAAFTCDEAWSDICATCGWLHDDHGANTHVN